MRVVSHVYVGYFLNDSAHPPSSVNWRDLDGRPYIWHVVERLKRCKKIDEVILFTQETPENKEVIDLSQKWNLNLRCCGIPWNWDTALEHIKSLNADVVIEGDFSPLIDPRSLNSKIDYFIEKDLDFLSSEDFLLYICKSGLWSKIYEVGKSDNQLLQRLIIYWPKFAIERTDLFKSEFFGKPKDIELLRQNRLKWFFLSRKIYKRFYRPPEIVDLDKVLKLYEEEPDFFEIPFSSQIEIEVTNDCNLNCVMCSRNKMSREVGCMDFSLFKKIVDKTYASSIHFSGLGEPLLHPQIKEMFAYVKGEGLGVGLWTNALSLDEGFSKQIIEREFVDYIIFGLDAATKETYIKVKGIDAFDKALENITRFLKLKKEKIAGMEKDTFGWWGRVKPIIGIQILKMKETDAEIEQFMDKWDFQDKLRKMLNWKQKMEEVSKELKPLEEELNKVKDRLNWKESGKGEISEAKKPGEVIDAEVKLQEKRRELMEPLDRLYWGTFYDKFLPVEHAIIGHFNNFCGQIEDRSVIDVTPLKRFSCKQLQSGISVLWNGDVVPCRQDFDGKYPLGNLQNERLSNILENQKLKDIWQAHKDGKYEKLPLCKDCKEWYYNPYA